MRYLRYYRDIQEVGNHVFHVVSFDFVSSLLDHRFRKETDLKLITISYLIIRNKSRLR